MPLICDTSMIEHHLEETRSKLLIQQQNNLTNMPNEKRQTKKYILYDSIRNYADRSQISGCSLGRDWLGRDKIDQEWDFWRCWLMSYILIKVWVTWMYGFVKTNQSVKLRSMHFTVCKSYPDKKILRKKSELHFTLFIF